MGRRRRHIETRGRQTDMFEFNPETKKLLEEEKLRKELKRNRYKNVSDRGENEPSDTTQEWWRCKNCGKDVPAPLGLLFDRL